MQFRDLDSGSCTFPVNAFVQQQHVGMVIRTIPAEIPDFATLALPEILRRSS